MRTAIVSVLLGQVAAGVTDASGNAWVDQFEPLQWTQGAGPIDPLHAPLEAFMRPPALDEARTSKEVELLQAQIEATHATEAAVDAQNQAMRKEIEGWRAAGEQVVEREGRIVDLVHQLRGEQQPSGAAGMMALLGQQVERAEANMVQNPRGYLLPLGVFVTFCCALLFGASLKERVLALPAKQVATCGAWGCCLRPMMQRAGVSRYVIEVSEITICLPSAPAGGDICVTVQMGRDSCLRTTSAVSLAGSPVYKFRDAFGLEVGKSDGLCVFGVIDRNRIPGMEVQKLARLEITAEDLLKAAHQHGTEYFRYGLCVSPVKSAPLPNGMIDEDSSVEQRPYLAMKIRDVSRLGYGPGHAGVQQGGLHMYSSDASLLSLPAAHAHFGTFSS